MAPSDRLRAWLGQRSTSDAEDHLKSGGDRRKGKRKLFGRRQSVTTKSEESFDPADEENEGCGRPKSEPPGYLPLDEHLQSDPLESASSQTLSAHHPPQTLAPRRSSSAAQNRYSTSSSARWSYTSTHLTVPSPESSLILPCHRKASIGEQSQKRSSRGYSGQWDIGNTRRPSLVHFGASCVAESDGISEGPGQGFNDGNLHRRGSGAGLKHNLASDTNDEPSFPKRFSRRPSHFEDVLEDPTESQGSDCETNQGANILVLRPKNNSKEANHTTFPEAAEISFPDTEQRNTRAATPDDNLSDELRSPSAEQIPYDLASPAIVESVVDPIRRDMVDRIMATVMVMLDLETDASDGSESSSPSDEPSMSGCESDYEFLSLEEEDAEDEPTDDGHQTSQAGTSTGNRTASLPVNQSGDSNVAKRAIGDRSSFDDDDDRGGAKRQRPATSRAGSEELSKKFACPYCKRYPHRIPKTPSCLHGFSSVPRLKEHLYRRHMQPIHCKRCYRSFPDEEHLTQHSRAEPICQNLQEPPDMEGITQQQLRGLKSRRKPKGEDNSEEGKWRRIYRILFPGAIEVPSPYCDYDHQYPAPASPGSQTCSRYHEYSRSRLPSLLRQEIEREACQGTQQIEEQIRGRLREIVERCVEAVLSEFRHHHLADVAAQPSDDDDGFAGAALQTSAAMESLAEMYSVPPPTRSPPDVPGFDACLAAQPGRPLDEAYSEAGWTGHAVPAGLEAFLDGRAFHDGFDLTQSAATSEAADLSNDGATLVEVSMQSEVPGDDAGLSKKVGDDIDDFLSDPALNLPPSA